LAQSINVGRTALYAFGVFVVFCVVVALLMKWPNLHDSPAVDSPDFAHLALLCRTSPTPTTTAPMTFMFALQEVATNLTHRIFLDRRAHVQVTDYLHEDVLLYTEAIDFGQQRVVRYAKGRQNTRQGAGCVVQPLKDEQDWMTLACEQAKTVRLDSTQMRVVVDLMPVQLTPEFFRLPMSCVPPTPMLLVDASVDFPETADEHVRATIGLSTPLALPRMLNEVLQMLLVRYTDAYVEVPELSLRLTDAFGRLAADSFNASRLAFARAPKPPTPPENTTFTAGQKAANAAADVCCGQDTSCRALVLSQSQTPGAASSLGHLCGTYQHCIATQDVEWTYNHPTKTGRPQLGCLRNERRCHCDFAFAHMLQLLDNIGCGDCLDDRTACDCLVHAWLIRHAVEQRPCWCQGTCTRDVALYMCDARELCAGFLTTSCDITLGWCMRTETYDCSRCHLPPRNDLSNHC
jgi:hypothetical protein